jgi:membrane fusion protein (multidrug efflux system)
MENVDVVSSIVDESQFEIVETQTPTEIIVEPELKPQQPEATRPQEKKTNRATRLLQNPWVLAAIALVVFAAIAYFVRNAVFYEDTDDAQVDGHIMPISARIDGHVLGVRVIEGQVVHAGDVLVTIDPSDYKIAADQAQANLDDAEAAAAGARWNVPITSVSVRSNLDSANTAVSNAEAAVKATQQNYEAAEAAVVQAEANAVKSDADLERYKKLVAKEDISRQRYDAAVATDKANRAVVESALAGLEAAEDDVAQSKGKLLQAQDSLRNAQTAPEQVSLVRATAKSDEAKVLQRKAQLAQAELNLGYTVIRAPVTGIVGKRSVEPGQNVSIGQELVDLVPLNDVWVTANFKETQLEHMRAGQPVEIYIDAYGRSWEGRVTNLGGGTGSVFSLLPPENATGNYVKVVQRVPVRIDFDRTPGDDFNTRGLLKPGLSAEPEVRVR